MKQVAFAYYIGEWRLLTKQESFQELCKRIQEF